MESLKIAAVNGSMRKNGNTDNILRLIESKLAEKGAEIEHIRLSDSALELCRGCRLCFDKGETLCPCKDDLLHIDAKLKEADCALFASPVYVEAVSGAMKNLIDRLAFHCHRPAFFGKPAALITTAAQGSTGRSLGTMRYALTSWGFTIAAAQRFRMGAKMDETEMKAYYDKTTEKIASNIMRCFQRGKARKATFFFADGF